MYKMLDLQKKNYLIIWNSLAVQWLGLCTSTPEGTGLIPGWGTEILQAVWPETRQC